MNRWHIALSVIAVAACPPTPSAINQPCDTTFDCVDDAVCIQQICRRACNDRIQCAASENCIDGTCLPDQPHTDASAPDGRSDAALRDQASGDLRSNDNNSGGDAARVEASRPDTAPVDIGGCGAMAACPQCGSRVCSDGAWGPCQNGTCGSNSSCNASGNCICDVDECSSDQCSGGDWYTCSVDAFGCGRLVFNTDCAGNDPCKIYGCSTNGCTQSNKCAGTCEAGVCCSTSQGDDCGGYCTCCTPPDDYQVNRGSYLCDGTCSYRAYCSLSYDCGDCCAHVPC